MFLREAARSAILGLASTLTHSMPMLLSRELNKPCPLPRSNTGDRIWEVSRSSISVERQESSKRSQSSAFLSNLPIQSASIVLLIFSPWESNLEKTLRTYRCIDRSGLKSRQRLFCFSAAHHKCHILLPNCKRATASELTRGSLTIFECMCDFCARLSRFGAIFWTN